MRQVREVLRLKWAIGLSERKIAHGLGISRPTVAEYVRRAQAAGLTWPLPTLLDEAALEQLLFPALPPRRAAPHPIPDWSTVHQELASITASATFSRSASPDNVACWYIMTLQ